MYSLFKQREIRIASERLADPTDVTIAFESEGYF